MFSSSKTQKKKEAKVEQEEEPVWSKFAAMISPTNKQEEVEPEIKPKRSFFGGRSTPKTKEEPKPEPKKLSFFASSSAAKEDPKPAPEPKSPGRFGSFFGTVPADPEQPPNDKKEQEEHTGKPKSGFFSLTGKKRSQTMDEKDTEKNGEGASKKRPGSVADDEKTATKNSKKWLPFGKKDQEVVVDIAPELEGEVKKDDPNKQNGGDEGDHDEEEEDKSNPLLSLVKFLLAILGMTLLALGLMLGLGIVYDSLVWDEPFKFYAYALPLFALVGVVLIVIRLVVRQTQKNRHKDTTRKLVYSFIVHIGFFVVAHLYLFSYLNTSTINHEYYLNIQVYNMLTAAGFRTQNGAYELKTLEDIDEVDDFWLWLKEGVVGNIFCEPDDLVNGACVICDSKLVIRQLHLRTIRVKGEHCKAKSTTTDVCFADLDPSQNEETGNWTIPTSPDCPSDFLRQVPAPGAWSNGDFETFTGKTLVSIPSDGEALNYHRGGYVFYIDPAKLTDLTKVRSCFDLLETNNFLDKQTRAVFLEVVFENRDMNFWHTANVQVEFLSSGGYNVRTTQEHGNLPSKDGHDIIPGFPKGPVGHCDSNTSTTCSPQPFIGDQLSLGLLLYVSFSVFFILDLIVYAHDDTVKVFLSRGWHYYTVITVVLLLIGLSMEIKAQESTPQGISWYNFIYYQRQQQLMLSFIILLIWVNFLQYARLSAWATVLSQTMSRAVRDILLFLFLFSFCLMGFAMQFYIIFGRVSNDFHTVTRSMFGVIRGLTGDMDAQSIYEYEPTVAFVVYGIFIVVVVFTLLTMLVAIINEHFLAVAMKLQNGEQSADQQGRADGEADSEEHAAVSTKDTEIFLKNVVPGRVHVCLVSGENFKSNEKQKKGADLYCKVCVLDESMQPRYGPQFNFVSRTVLSTSAPVWEECFGFKVRATDSLRFTVFDRSPNEDWYMGDTTVSVDDISPEGDIEHVVIDLEDRRSFFPSRFFSHPVTGKITFKLTTRPKENKKKKKKNP